MSKGELTATVTVIALWLSFCYALFSASDANRSYNIAIQHRLQQNTRDSINAIIKSKQDSIKLLKHGQ